MLFLFKHLSHTTDNLIGYNAAESISRALQSNTSLTSLDNACVFLFKHLSHTTVNNIGYAEYLTEKRKPSFTQVSDANPATRAKLDILPIGEVGLGESKQLSNRP